MFTKTASVRNKDHRGDALEGKLKQPKRLKTVKQVSVQQSEFVAVQYGEADETEVSGLERWKTWSTDSIMG